MNERLLLLLVLFIVVLATAAQLLFEGLSMPRAMAALGAIILVGILWFRPARK